MYSWNPRVLVRKSASLVSWTREKKRQLALSNLPAPPALKKNLGSA